MSVRRELLSKSCLFPSLRISAVAKVFGCDERWGEFFFSHKRAELRATPEELLKEAACFSHGEQILVQVALDIWCEQGKTRLTDLIEVLDEDAFIRVISALLHFREITTQDLYDHMRTIDEG